MLNIKERGQIFTPQNIVNIMWSLSKNNGRYLEPSCGNGALLKNNRDFVAIEKDKNIAHNKSIIMNFFEYNTSNKFDTIIGNPPYVKYNDIEPETKTLLSSYDFDKRSNLYLFFIRKCCEHLNDKGELIFITPRDFIKLTSAIKLNYYLNQKGSITDFIEFGDKKVFKNAAPNVCIWRWQKKLKHKNVLHFEKGQFYFEKIKNKKILSDYFKIKVGGVSGADNIFTNEKYGNVKFINSKTRKNNSLKTMIYNKKCEYLNEFKNVLLNRKIKKFNDDNWWTWGRDYYHSNKNRIYVNCKTRQQNPFFQSDIKEYDGSVLALIPRKEVEKDLSYWVKKLNNLNWEKFGFVCGGRYVFNQKSLSNIPIS